MRYLIILVLLPLLVFTLQSAAQSAGRPLTYASIDVPGAGATIAEGISAQGTIVGYYSTALNPVIHHGFLSSNGTFSTLDVPGATLGTDVFGINAHGSLVGDYFDTDLAHGHGFVETSGAFRTIDFPQAMETAAIGINNSGAIVGAFISASWDQHGFLLSRDGHFSKLDFPGATVTVARGINDAGDIAGFYLDAQNLVHGFVLSAGVFRTINVPVANAASNTVLYGINSAGVLVGGYGLNHGFWLSKAGFQSVDFPGAVSTVANGVSIAGGIVGNYFDAQGIYHGFFAFAK